MAKKKELKKQLKRLDTLLTESVEYQRGYQDAMHDHLWDPHYVLGEPAKDGEGEKKATFFTIYDDITAAIKRMSANRVPGSVLYKPFLNIPEEKVAKKKDKTTATTEA